MAKIETKIKVTSWFKKYTNGIYEFCMEIEAGTKIGEIIKKLGIPEDEIGSLIVEKSDQLSEKRRVEFEYEIRNGDQILIIPPILGG